MLIRLLIAMALALLGNTTVVAGTCDCSPEIKNAKAKVTSSCSKIWSSNQCTLKELGATSSEWRQTFGGNKGSRGLSALERTLRRIPTVKTLKDRAVRRVAQRLTNFEYIRDARANCLRRQAVEKSDLMMVLIDSVLTVDSNNKIDFLFDPKIVSSVIDFVNKQNVTKNLCASEKIKGASGFRVERDQRATPLG